MAFDAYNITRPGQANGTGVVNANHIEEFGGLVQGTLERMSVCAPRIPLRSIRGTSILSNFGVGKSTVGAITVDGSAPQATSQNKFGKTSIAIDTTILARAVLPLLEQFQTSYDSRAEIAKEHGKELAKQFDSTFFIQATKAGQLTANKFGLTAAGHTGGSQVTFTGASDYLDPALLYQAIVDLVTQMQLKDVDPVGDGVIIGIDPVGLNTLAQAELLINGEYITATGLKVGGLMLKSYGLPVIGSNNFCGGQNISGHLLSNAVNSNAYDGDFTKVVATAFAPAALIAGETIPLTAEVFRDPVSKQWFVDAYRAYAVTPSIAAFAGVILKP
jgi:hypothetical protein